ncbi:MAG: hypothetical protein FWE61_10665, partial [Micrococcales bacterium]|nr:hypothetical protein [Micrococcales bacterium]
MWAAARANTVGVILQSTAAFDAVAAQTRFKYDLKGITTVGKVAMETAGLFFPKGVEKGGKFSLAVITALSNSTTTAGTVATYGSVLDDVFTGGLDSIATEILNVEERICTNVCADMDKISDPDENVRVNWQLPNPDPLDLSDEPGIATDAPAVTNIRNYMKEIVDILTGVVASARGSNHELVSSVLRGSDLGCGHYGPGLVLQELNDMFCDLLNILKRQIDGSADNLYAACMIQLGNDSEAAAQLQASTAALESLDNLDGYDDPWRYSKDPNPSAAAQYQMRSERFQQMLQF